MHVAIRDCMVTEKEFKTPIEGMRHLGVDTVEIQLQRDFSVSAMTSHERITLQSDADATAYAQTLRDSGIRPCAFLTACDFSAGDAEDNVAWIARAIELAHLLGMPAVRIDSAMRREQELSFEERVRLFADGLRGAVDRTQGLPVALGIENHGFQGNNLAFQLNVYMDANPPGASPAEGRIGATMDTGNFYWRGYPLTEVYGILRVLAPYAKHTHLKNIRYPEKVREQSREGGWKYGEYVSPLAEGDIDHARVVRILAKAGYDGALCLEDESLSKCAGPEERIAVLEADVRHMRECIAAVG